MQTIEALQRKFEQCQKEIETAMAEMPHCAIPHNLMRILMETESNHILAMKHFRAAYALDPTYIPARYNMELYGQMYRTGKYAYTEEDCPVENDKRMEKSNTIIAGCGRLGASIAGKLSEQKKDVMIIDCDKTAFRKLPLSFGGLTLAASVTDLERLKVAEIDRTTLFLAVTDDDCTNICAGTV